jgi:His-Xaa-Ser system protein HxsD
MSNRIEEGSIIVFLDSSIFTKDAVLKCLYWYGDKFHTDVAVEGHQFKITIKPHSVASVPDGELNLYLIRLERDLIDFNLRDIVTKETINVRELLIAKAFSNGEFDEQPKGELSDPVGFNPTTND